MLKLQETSLPELMNLLRKGGVAFRYKRKTYNMRARTALGTLNFSMFNIPTPKGSKPPVPGLVRYWDLERNRWRSFYFNNVEFYAIQTLDKSDVDDLKRPEMRITQDNLSKRKSLIEKIKDKYNK